MDEDNEPDEWWVAKFPKNEVFFIPTLTLAQGINA
jgi:hypothetical protein